MGTRTEVIETYNGWSPPAIVRSVIDRLLASVPSHFLTGLRSVVLTNGSGLNHDRRRKFTKWRRRKVREAAALGLYHHSTKGQQAWVEIFVDNILTSSDSVCLHLAPLADLTFGGVLFHEIGHHVHATRVPEFREKEDVADKSADRLLREHMWRRHWFVMGFLWPVVRLMTWRRAR